MCKRKIRDLGFGSRIDCSTYLPFHEIYSSKFDSITNYQLSRIIYTTFYWKRHHFARKLTVYCQISCLAVLGNARGVSLITVVGTVNSFLSDQVIGVFFLACFWKTSYQKRGKYVFLNYNCQLRDTARWSHQQRKGHRRHQQQHKCAKNPNQNSNSVWVLYLYILCWFDTFTVEYFLQIKWDHLWTSVVP